MTYDVILVATSPMFNASTRSYGPYRLASELRLKGYSVLVINHAMFLDIDVFLKILNLAIGNNTLCVGISTSWFMNVSQVGNMRDDRVDFPDGDTWYLKKEGKFHLVENSVMYKFSKKILIM